MFGGFRREEGLELLQRLTRCRVRRAHLLLDPVHGGVVRFGNVRRLQDLYFEDRGHRPSGQRFDAPGITGPRRLDRRLDRRPKGVGGIGGGPNESAAP